MGRLLYSLLYRLTGSPSAGVADPAGLYPRSTVIVVDTTSLGVKPATLNVVAVLYRWSMRRTARGKRDTPTDIEATLGTTKRGTPWPRLAVPFAMVLCIMEMIGAVVVLLLATLLIAVQTVHSAPAISVVFHLTGSLIATFPMALVAVVGIWCLLPERRTGGFLRHPERLWVPSIVTLLVTAFLGLLLWDGIPLAA